ncbi:hypothetical protein GF343_05995, partial [Candidatus Woesearchaeota archaeon]|nr:hypothetical protein [Candidatus Woesearchaeota archaeon]
MNGQAWFNFTITVPQVNSDTNLTFLVMRINDNNSTEFENRTILFLNDTTSPNITSLTPSNSTLANSIQTITANVQENESQLQLVNYTYGDCNGTNTTITL